MIMSEEPTTEPIKRKPVMFSANLNVPVTVNLSKSEPVEVNGFEEQRQHKEKVQHLLDKATNMIIWDIRQHPPKRR